MRARFVTRFGSESGQAAVETAIVMPLFVFIVLGLVQLSLMHQARLLTKYAAYKAARAGSVNRAEKDVMNAAAIAVMLPMIVRGDPISEGSDGTQPQYGLYKIENASDFTDGFREVHSTRDNEMFDKPIIELTVCHPLSSDVDEGDDFDDPATNPNGSRADWRPNEKTKLSVQVTTYLNLIIPFANAFLWWASIGDMGDTRVATMKTLRMNHDGGNNDERQGFGDQEITLRTLRSEAERGNYIMPIRASYSLRMHSNVSADADLPDENECHVPFNQR